MQALLMHGRIAKTDAVKPSTVVLDRHLLSKVEGPAVESAHSEEAMRAQAAAERLLGGPANG